MRFRHPAGSTSGSDLKATEIVDPFGQVTSLIRDSAGRLSQIREPGGRYLQINYTTYSRIYGPTGETLSWDVISSVQAFSAPGQLVETVTYEYATSYHFRHTFTYLTRANYDDGTHAQYTYEQHTLQDPLGNGVINLIQSCDDVRFAGPMKRIKYEYEPQINSGVALGQIKREKNLTTSQTVSEVTYPPYDPNGNNPSLRARRTETRGDGATREFQYSEDWTKSDLESYTDFKGQRSHIAYEIGSLGHYVQKLTNARGHVTRIEKDAYSDAVKSITHPDGSIARFTYTNYYYLSSRTDERGHITYHDRDANNRIWQTRYPDGSSEGFTYNPFWTGADASHEEGRDRELRLRWTRP